jgi:hypothetical protein
MEEVFLPFLFHYLPNFAGLTYKSATQYIVSAFTGAHCIIQPIDMGVNTKKK